MASSVAFPSVGSPTDSKTEAYSVKQLVTGSDLIAKFKKLKDARAMTQVQWQLNLNMYAGKQYSFWNRAARRIDELPTSDGEKPRYRIRLTSNQIMPGAQGLVAKMTKTKPVINATPGSSDPKDARAAQFAERLVEFWWDDLRLDDKLYEALMWAVICSQGYWLCTWDPQAGKPMKFTLDPEGNPITDTNLRTMYLREIAQQGISPEQVEKTFYMGDVRVDVISPFNVYLDPTETAFEKCKYACVVGYMDPDEVYARYGKWIQPDSRMGDYGMSNMNGNSLVSNNDSKSTCKILTWYFKPTPIMPKGRVVCVAETSAQILDDSMGKEWPFPSHELPLTKFGLLKVPGSVYDSSVVEHAIPIQQELNRTLSQIVEYKNLTIKPRVWAPVGSMQQRMTNEPGAVYQYTPIGGMKPEIEQLPSMPPYVFEHLKDISNRLQDTFYTTEVEGGTLPPNVEAAAAIDLLQEMSSDKIAPAIKLMEKAIGYAGQQLLGIAQKNYIEPRLLMIKGANGSPTVQEFSRADIVGGINIAVESGSGLPRTRAGRMAQIHELVDKGYISPQQGLKRMGIADLNGPLAAIAADEDQALREHEKIMAKIPINPDAVRQAIQAVQTPDPQFGAPVNPDTGKPFTSMEEIQQFIHDAGLQPLPYEDYATHREQHALWMKSVDFENLPPDIQSDALKHFNLTFQALMNLPVPGTKGPAVNLQIKGTAGPTVMSEILNRNGVVKVSPDQFQENPEPTWISEAINVGQPTSDPVAEAQRQAEQAKADATNTQTQLAIQAADQAHAESLQKQSHAEQMHQQAHQQAHEKHQAALAKQKEPKPPARK